MLLLFSWKMPLGQNDVILLEKSEFSGALGLLIFFVCRGGVRRETEVVFYCTEDTFCKVGCVCVCIGFFILRVPTLKQPEMKTSVLPSVAPSCT